MAKRRPPITKKEALAVRVITKKLRLNSQSLLQLREAEAAGIPGDVALANLLGLEPGGDATAFLREKLSPGEYSMLKTILSRATDGSPLDVAS